MEVWASVETWKFENKDDTIICSNYRHSVTFFHIFLCTFYEKSVIDTFTGERLCCVHWSPPLLAFGWSRISMFSGFLFFEKSSEKKPFCEETSVVRSTRRCVLSRNTRVHNKEKGLFKLRPKYRDGMLFPQWAHKLAR